MEKRYATGLADAQWELVKPHVPAARGRLPVADVAEGLPYWSTVHSCFWRWKRNGVLDRLHEALRSAERTRLGRDPSPTAGVTGSQSVKTTEKGSLGATTRTRR